MFLEGESPTLNLLADTNFTYFLLQQTVWGLAQDQYVKLLNKI